MVQVGTRVRTCDNSGALLCRCIKILCNCKANGQADIGINIEVVVC